MVDPERWPRDYEGTSPSKAEYQGQNEIADKVVDLPTKPRARLPFRRAQPGENEHAVARSFGPAVYKSESRIRRPASPCRRPSAPTRFGHQPGQTITIYEYTPLALVRAPIEPTQNLITAPQFNHHSAGSLRTLTASSGPGVVRSSSPGLAKTCWPIRTRSGTQCTRAEPSMNAGNWGR